MENNSSENKSNSILIGTLIIIAGALLILFNIEPFASIALFQNLRRLIFSWPMILIVLSILSFTKGKSEGGIILLILGLIFIAPYASFLFPHHIFRNLFTSRMALYVGLIALGIIIVVNAMKDKSDDGHKHISENSHSSSFGNARMNTGADKKIDYKFTLSGANQVYQEPVFYGGSIKCTLGGMELDLTHSSLPEGETYLNIKSVLGGVNLLIPADWYVEIRTSCTLGGFSDSRKVTGTPDSGRKLIIYADCVLGGGNIE